MSDHSDNSFGRAMELGQFFRTRPIAPAIARASTNGSAEPFSRLLILCHFEAAFEDFCRTLRTKVCSGQVLGYSRLAEAIFIFVSDMLVKAPITDGILTWQVLVPITHSTYCTCDFCTCTPANAHRRQLTIANVTPPCATHSGHLTSIHACIH